jgi:hypothetical protein
MSATLATPSVERRGEAVGDMARHLAVEDHRPAPEPGVEGRGPGGDGGVVGDDLHQGHEVGRMERMRHQDALRMGAIDHQGTAQHRGGARRDEDVGRQTRIHLGEQRALHGLVLGRVLLDEIRAGEGRLQPVVRPEGALPRQTELSELGAGRRDGGRHPLREAGGRIVGRDIEPVGEEQGGPTGAQGSAAQHGHPRDFILFVVRQNCLPGRFTFESRIRLFKPYQPFSRRTKRATRPATGGTRCSRAMRRLVPPCWFSRP